MVVPGLASVGATCAIGTEVRQIYASMRAGIGRHASSDIVDGTLQPITMALLPESALQPLRTPIATQLPPPFRRILRFAAAALRECVSVLPVGAPVPLFLGLPYPEPGTKATSPKLIVEALAAQATFLVDVANSAVFPHGHAASLLALEAASQFMRTTGAPHVVVGGLDTHFDLARIDRLLAEGRILGPMVADGFVPGEGAAFLLLNHPRAGYSGVRLLGTGTATDAQHRYSDEPARGEGLARAIERLLTVVRPAARISNTFASLNGESFGAKEWGVARLRHTDIFESDARIEHPADCYGDVGAATGALLLALAVTALSRRDRQGPTLVWASSDRGERACALIDFPG